jgi:ABC-type transport system involved in cytochrome bd biosynthesis fused ATPase/permease subunit
MPYGKRRKEKPQQQTQGTIMYDDGDLGISKIDFTSPPVTLTWFNLEAKAPPQDKGLKRTLTKKLCPSKEVGQSKMLLKGVSGIAKPGQLVAIMGASGAGKTTLMNILTTRRPGNLKVTGEVRVNGTKMGRHINRVAGYVQQEELFIPSMTTREHLHFHVR